MGKRKQLFRLAILLFLIAAGLLVCAVLQVGGQQYARAAAIQKNPEFLQDLSFFSVEMSSPAGSQEIHPWTDDQGESYLFLPGCARQAVCKAHLTYGYELLLDGQQVENGQQLSLSPGDHRVSLPEYRQSQLLHVMCGSGQAAAFLQTESRSMEHIHAQKGNEEGGYAVILQEDGAAEYAGFFTSLHGRGNVTWDESDKKGYQLTLKQSAPLFGMEAARKWLLIPNTFDPSMMRNSLIFSLARQMELGFVPQSRYIDLYINGDYLGLYQLFEKVEPQEGRLEIAPLEQENRRVNGSSDTLEEFGWDFLKYLPSPMNQSKGYLLPRLPEDNTGGYLLELELDWRYQSREHCGFVTRRNQHVVVKQPKHAAVEQVEYIRRVYQAFEDAAYAPDGREPRSGKTLEELIDLPSFAKKYLIEELSKNLDAAITSQYFYKPQDSVDTRLYAGPVWDYDRSLGIEWIALDYTERMQYDLSDPTGFYANEPITEGSPWYALYRDPAFYSQVTELYWNELLPAIRYVIEEEMEQLACQLWPSVQMNQVRWQVWPDAHSPEQWRWAYEKELNHIRDFLTQRSQWLCQQWPRPAA